MLLVQQSLLFSRCSAASCPTVRTVLGFVGALELECDQGDVDKAFLNAPLSQPVYALPPRNWPEKRPGFVWKLTRACYGVRRSSKCGYDCASSFLISEGWKRCEFVRCCFSASNEMPFWAKVRAGLWGNATKTAENLDQLQTT